jgi:hypothetical protein
VSVEGLGQAYSPADRSRTVRSAAEVDPDVGVAEWAAAAALWRFWRPPRRLSDDALAELRLEIDGLRRSLEDLEDVVTEELRARDRKATGERD